MNKIVRHISWLFKGIKVYALVGKSGTGKSFRAKLVGQKYSIDLIIDDGLLIRNKKILAGKSAKKEKVILKAIKTALFDDIDHRNEVRKCLLHQDFKRILIIGTSDRMVKKIASTLRLPNISRFIRIEDIATEEEIETAIRSRNLEGKHIIPVPSIEINRNYPHIFYDSIKIFFKTKLPFLKKTKVFEKAIVRPEYGKKGRVILSETALTQMVLHCADEYDPAVTVKKVSVKNDTNGYKLAVYIHLPYGVQIAGNIHNLQEYIVDNLERYTGIMIDEVNIIINDISRQ